MNQTCQTTRTRSTTLSAVETDILRFIAEQRFPPGAMLPGFTAIAMEIGAAPATVQRAIGLLAKKGVVRSEKRRGTFLARLPHDDERPTVSAAPSYEGPLTRAGLKARVGIIAPYMFAPEVIGSWERQQRHWPLAIIYAIERVLATEPEVDIFFKTYLNEQPDFEKLTKDAVADGADALMIVGEETHGTVAAAKVCKALPVPSICASLQRSAGPARVFSDIAMSGYQAARHLLSRGYQSLTYFSPVDLDFVRERLSGINQALSDAGFDRGILRTVICDTAGRIDYSGLTRAQFDPSLLDGQPGVIASNDVVAYSILDIAEKRNLSPGEDFGIVGFDDWEFSRTRSLTSLRPPVDAIGAEAGRNMLRILRGETFPSELVIQWQLIPRSSSKISCTARQDDEMSRLAIVQI